MEYTSRLHKYLAQWSESKEVTAAKARGQTYLLISSNKFVYKLYGAFALTRGYNEWSRLSAHTDGRLELLVEWASVALPFELEQAGFTAHEIMELLLEE